MKVLITGGMGVIGSEASRKFVKEGHRPVLYARHRDDNLIADLADKVDIALGDVTDLPRLLDVIKTNRITHIVHAAAFVGAVSQANPPLSIDVNVRGTVNVLEAARLFGIRRVVFTSAKGVYGPLTGEFGYPNYRPIPEDMPKNPKRIYDAAKQIGEHLCLYYNDTMGVDSVVLRFATTYGPGKTARHGKMGVTSQIVEAPAAGKPFHIAQGGDEKDDFIYNKDSALGIYLATIAENPKSRVYNIGSGVGSTLRDFERALRRHIPDADISIGPGLNFLGMPYPMHGIYDVTRARDELGFKCEYDIDRGVEDYLRTLRAIRV
ncbi:NAD-dependent epimerase/dehydratase family protein [Pseudorhodoplanes sp.]|uniref:NAD-dependent epimerase/dehydratase family protein n=1 Tax=Pseudorhodoplanes sp. TaxID=1934341 RepID=UPI002C8A8B05|nr:NAD-dependent epimerase/dehydratase family protein [Pseudorhodoplanes sp.]HWV41550.1 NAD-dependent epimerase/dehydratase family protein [Pseudorhodoplanes sp.]